MIYPVYASKFINKLDLKEREALINSGIIPVNDVYMPYWNSTQRHQIYYGGRGSGKSKFIAQKLVNKCAFSKYLRCQYSRKHQVDIKESQFELLKQTISEFKLWRDFTFNASTLRITHRTGNCFIAKGMDDPEKSKGILDLTTFWGEEITEFDQEDVVGVNQNLRTLKGTLESYYSFNPVHERNWARSYFFTSEDRHLIKPELGDAVALRTTLYHNFFIDQKQYALDLVAGAAGNKYIIKVVLEGDWGLTENNHPWLYAFNEDIHIRPVEVKETYPVYLSFDFNANPLTCTAWQRSPNVAGAGAFCHAIDEFGGHMKLEDLCMKIRTSYPNHILYVTGDRNGNNEDFGRNQTAYQMIQNLLNLSPAQMNLNSSNLEHFDSRMLCNMMFTKYPVIIDPCCENLIDDIRKAKVDTNHKLGSQLLKDREENKMDYFDNMRYFFQTYYNEYIRDTYLKATIPSIIHPYTPPPPQVYPQLHTEANRPNEYHPKLEQYAKTA